jgi:beta-galactosidase
MAETLSIKTTGLWPMSTLPSPTSPTVKVERANGTVHLSVRGRYSRPDAPEQAFVGGYDLDLADSGVMSVSYDFTPDKAKGILSEAGLSIVVPAAFNQFRWIGQGPYAGYPGKDRLNEFGLYHLQSDDLRFQGNRRGTELALLTTAAGNGLALAAPVSDVAVERDGDRIVLSHNALIGGLGNKGTRPETTIKPDDARRIAGKFTLLPLTTAWPDALTRWFGKPAAATDVFHPFYHSYDQ